MVRFADNVHREDRCSEPHAGGRVRHRQHSGVLVLHEVYAGDGFTYGSGLGLSRTDATNREASMLDRLQGAASPFPPGVAAGFTVSRRHHARRDS